MSEPASEFRPMLVSYSLEFVTDEQMRLTLDALPEVSFWYQCISGSIFIVSSATPQDLALSIELLFKGRDHMFFVVELDITRMEGRLPTAAWNAIIGATSRARG